MRHARAHSIFATNVPRSRSHEGRFGRLFGRGFSVWQPPGADDAARLAAIETYAADQMFGTPAPAVSATPAGFTYFGQFIDHDITFDPQSSLTKKNDPDGLQNFRTPRLDLDSLYGRGPDDQPYLFDQHHPTRGLAGSFLIGTGEVPTERDLQRNGQGTAIIGDPRNDENLIVSQLQLTFQRLHNRVLELLDGRTPPELGGRELFDEAQRITRWFYQQVVWNDFIGRIVDPAIFAKAIQIAADGTVTYGLDQVYDWSVNPFIPVEFSVAAYRFGHSMIRTGYQLNFPRQGGIGEAFELPIFDFTNPPGSPATDDLRGGRGLPKERSLQWDWFFQLPSSGGPFPQMANKIDRHISRSVLHVPSGPTGSNPLAVLNIRRGWSMQLPPATEVAKALGVVPMQLEDPMEESLWVYILKEAETLGGGERLGPVGSTLVAAVFSGLLRGDPQSWLNKDASWTPDKEGLFAKISPAGAHWEIADIIRAARMPEDAGAVSQWFIGNLP